MKTIEFKVSSFRKIPNPYVNIDSDSKMLTEPSMYILICDVKNLPKDIPMEKTNPRNQKETTKVARQIISSLKDDPDNNFYLLNRGILLSAKSINFNNVNKIVSIFFEDENLHGNVDGGHTYEIIKKYSDQVEYNQQFVKIEVLTGVENMFELLAKARNTSLQVSDSSIANLENKFDFIKKILNENNIKNINYKQNGLEDNDISDVVAILHLFNLDKYPIKNSSNLPISSYSGKDSCMKNFIKTYDEYQNRENMNPYFKMAPILVDFFKLYDYLEEKMPEYYLKTGPNKKYGSIKGVLRNNDLYSKFLKNKIDYSTSAGFIFPLLGSLRALLIEENGVYKWRKDPYKILDKLGPELINSIITTSRQLGNNPSATGKNNNIWSNLFMRVYIEALQEE